MDWSVYISAAIGLIGVVVGWGSTAWIENRRRRGQQEWDVVQDRRSTYSDFLAAVVRWQNAAIWETLRKERESGGWSIGTAPEVVARHQDAMPFLFRLHLIAGAEVTAVGLRLFHNVQARVDRLDSEGSSVREETHEIWMRDRDAFIGVARAETVAES